MLDQAAGSTGDGSLEPYPLRLPSHHSPRREEGRKNHSPNLKTYQTMTLSSPINPWSSRHITAEHGPRSQLDSSPRALLIHLNAIEDAISQGLIVESLPQRARRIVEEGRARGLIKQAPFEPLEPSNGPPP